MTTSVVVEARSCGAKGYSPCGPRFLLKVGVYSLICLSCFKIGCNFQTKQYLCTSFLPDFWKWSKHLEFRWCDTIWR